MNRQTSARAGIMMAVGAYLLWGGAMPVFLKLLRPMPPVDILCNRILWSLLLLALLAWPMRRIAAIWGAVRNARLMAMLSASAVLIAANWLIYVSAVNGDHVVQASLGYFINPLVNVLLGVIFLRERMSRPAGIAILLATIGVAGLAIWQHALPLLSLALAVTFGLYGLVRKMAPIDAFEGLLVETALLSPVAAGWLIWNGSGMSPAGPSLGLLSLSGVITTAPLLMFAGAAKRLRYADLGLLQYIAPTMQLLLGVFAYGEPLLPIHLFTFGCIWSGLAIYAISSWRAARMMAIPE